jgi:hypothetical protein
MRRIGIVNLLSSLSNAQLMCRTRGMNPLPMDRYKYHRFPAEIISHGVGSISASACVSATATWKNSYSPVASS